MKWFLPVPALLGSEALASPLDLAGRLLLLLLISFSFPRRQPCAIDFSFPFLLQHHHYVPYLLTIVIPFAVVLTEACMPGFTGCLWLESHGIEITLFNHYLQTTRELWCITLRIAAVEWAESSQ
jgi:hypothetical protein